jgi:hypothetical protein
MRKEQMHQVVIKKQPPYTQQVVNRMALPSWNLTDL